MKDYPLGTQYRLELECSDVAALAHIVLHVCESLL